MPARLVSLALASLASVGLRWARGRCVRVCVQRPASAYTAGWLGYIHARTYVSDVDSSGRADPQTDRQTGRATDGPVCGADGRSINAQMELFFGVSVMSLSMCVRVWSCCSVSEKIVCPPGFVTSKVARCERRFKLCFSCHHDHANERCAPAWPALFAQNIESWARARL
jgi:hypothetical protein